MLLLLACTGPPSSGDDTTDDSVAEVTSGPSAPGVGISPEAPEDGDAMTCQVLEDSVDPDGRQVYYVYSWTVDGVETEHGAEVPADTTQPFESWTCTVTPFAGDVEGEAATASVAIIDGNDAPGPPTIRIFPADPADNQDLVCEVLDDGDDPDGDALEVTTEWLVEGESIAHEGPVDRSMTSEGESWTCSARSSDGELSSPAVTATASIGPPEYTGDLSANEGAAYSASDCFACPDETWYIADKAFDDLTCTTTCTWHTTWNDGPHWVAVDFGEGNEIAVSRYTMMGATFSSSYSARDWELQGSTDGGTWDTLHTVTSAGLEYVMYGSESPTMYTFENATAYRHWRIHVSANEGGHELGIMEIELMSDAPPE